MCKQNPKTEPNSPPKKSALWDIPANQRCAVIGTCIEVSQLKQLATRFDLYAQHSPLISDYDLHSYFVSIADSKNQVSVALNKLLNKQFHSYSKNINACKTDAKIESVWSQVSSDDTRSLAGNFWAILSSKYASGDLKFRVYGDIHMISHIAGLSHKNKIQKLVNDQQDLLVEIAKKDRFLNQKSEQIQQQRENTSILEARNVRQSAELKRLKSQHTKGDSNRSEVQLDYSRYLIELQQEIDALKLALKTLHTKKIEKINHQAPANTRFSLNEEKNKSSCDGDCNNCESNDLCGKKILYVGGFSRHRKKFQQLTESINGRFFYHDGGKQQSEHQLDEMVKKVDAIFCPVDCISHSAISRIKNIARSQCKDCIFLKSASLSSFKNEVRRYAS